MVTLLLILLQFTWLSVCVHSQVVNFPCLTFCPEVSAVYHCVITSAVSRWTVSGSVSGTNSFSAGDAIGHTLPVGSSFTANKTDSTSFSLNFIANVEFNNSVTVECRDLVDGNSNTNSRQCTIMLEGPPTTSPSSLSYDVISSTSVNISWSPSSEQCLDYYNVTVTNQNTNQQEIFNTTSTSLTISNRLEGIQHSYTVSVVDGANRIGPQSNSGCFNLKTPEQVPDLTAMATDFPDDLTQVNATANISVQWIRPTSSCPHPDVNYYRVVHNVTNNDINITVIVPTPSTTLTITGATLGSTYTIEIQANNILGYGPTAMTKIVVPTSSLPPEPTLSILTVSTNPGPLVTPTSSCSRNEDTSCSSSTTIAITVTFLLTAIFSSILTLVLTLLFVYVYIKRSRSGRKEPVKPVGQVVYEEVHNSDSTSPVPLTTNPAYGPVGQ